MTRRNITDWAAPLRRVADLLGVLLLTGLSVALLCYIGYGEARRTYPSIELDRVAAEGDVVAHAMESFALAGLPLAQFPGFDAVATPLLDSDPALAAVYVTDARGQVVLSSGEDQIETEGFSKAAGTGRHHVDQNDSFYRVTLPLESRLETVGHVHVLLYRGAVAAKIDGAFSQLALAAVLVLALCGAGALGIARWRRHSVGWTNALYGLTIAVVSGLAIATLVGLHVEGIQGKTRALAGSLGARLGAPVALGMDLDDLSELDVLFHGHRQLNPDISFIALTEDGVVTIDTDQSRVGAPWQPSPGHFEYDLPVAASSAAAGASQLLLRIGVPVSVVFEQLWRSLKNFLVLIVAAGMLSLLGFDLLRSLTRGREAAAPDESAAPDVPRLSVLRLFYFLVVFIDGLSTSFLPVYTQQLAEKAGLDRSYASWVFTAYFLAFMLVLIPAGQLAQRRGCKPLLALGTVLACASIVAMALVPSFYALLLARILAGCAQGMLVIGVQSYFLGGSSAQARTRGAGIIVFGYNGGIISGAALGALLAVYIGFQGVFLVGAATALLLVWYTLALIPAQPPGPVTTAPRGEGRLLSGLGSALRDLEFVKATVLIGVPTKAVLTGVTVFALPLLLSRQHYVQEDIGQVVMLYAACVLVSSSYVSRLVEALGRTRTVLVTGALGSGLGLILVGLAGSESLTGGAGGLGTVLLVVGMMILGLSHGCINAPIVAHIAATPAASALGPSGATSLYRFVERIGHVAGPMLVGQILIFGQDSLVGIGWVGAAVIVLAVVFLLTPGRGTASPQPATVGAQP
ncbi:MAG TPA: MFS transporter [Chloroflexota bacterium]